MVVVLLIALLLVLWLEAVLLVLQLLLVPLGRRLHLYSVRQ